MDKEKMIRECLMITCFLEYINSHEKDRIVRILNALNEYSLAELKTYYEINLQQVELRIDRMLSYQ